MIAYPNALIRRCLRYGTLMALATVVACASKYPAASHSTQQSDPWRDAVGLAVRAMPIDSLCFDLCSVIVIDTMVRAAPSRGSLDVTGLPFLGSMSLGEFGQPRARDVQVIPGAFILHSAAVDTVRIATAFVRAVPAETDTVVLVTIMHPDALGTIAIVELYRENAAWRIRRIRLLEA
jgi:hypothetical protein